MSPIPRSRLNDQIVVVNEDDTLTAAVTSAQDAGIVAAPGLWVVVRLSAGGYAVLEAEHFHWHRSAHPSEAGLRISDCSLETPAATTVEIDAMGEGEADRTRARAPGRLLLLLEAGVPIGVFADVTLGVDEPWEETPPDYDGEVMAGNGGSDDGGDVPRSYEPEDLDPGGRNYDPDDDGGAGEIGGDAAAAEAEGDEAAEEVDGNETPPGRRLGADVIVEGNILRNAFIADVITKVRVSIGRTATHDTGEAFPPVDFEEDQDEVELPVWAQVAGATHHGTITLPRDERLDSSVPFEFSFTPEGGADQSIQIVVYNREGDDVLQAALLRGSVVESAAVEAAAEKSLEMSVVGVQSLVNAPATLPRGSLVASEAGMLLKTADAVIGISASDALHWITGTVADIHRTGAAHVSLGAAVEKTIVNLAGRGAIKLAQNPELRRLAACERIQVVSPEKKAIFPLDLLYSGPIPNEDATLCTHWKQALREGECADCGAGGPVDGSTVCPLQFWSMSKIIEHHGPGEGSGGTFSALGYRTLSSGTLDPLEPMLVGVSEKVLEVDAGAITDVTAAAGDNFGPVSAADDWSDWKDHVENQQPGLLVAMPHQELTQRFGADLAELELGGENVAVFAEDYVSTAEEPPGPVVLLFGCDTGVGLGPMLPSWASYFRALGASVVVSSLGKVIAEEAPVATQAFLQQLAKATEHPTATLGDALRDTRRALLADSVLLSLMLVSHGDNDWKVT